MQIIVVRHNPGPVPQALATVAYGDLATVLAHAQWLVLACPLTDVTKRLIDQNMLAALPPGASVVNVSRGEVVAEQALIAALQSNHLAGAFLDVFEHEPLPAASPQIGRASCRDRVCP